ncbi:MAG TPA: dienelactone hydrolase family protein [Candidatus Limnocylindria bacterium]|nr:dienelactone hydrolase family protein [Candidatus Limnocylindria bacterium]
MSGGVLVLHAWWGLNDDVLAYAQRLGQEGYVTSTPDLYRRRVATTIDEAKALDEKLDVARASNEVSDALTKLRERANRVAVLGWSLGAFLGWNLVQARAAEIRAFVPYYGLRDVDASAALPPILGHFAEHDEFEDLAQVRRTEKLLLDAGRDARLHVYPNTKHWFAEPSRPEFDQGASDLAFERTREFLDTHLRR